MYNIQDLNNEAVFFMSMGNFQDAARLIRAAIHHLKFLVNPAASNNKHLAGSPNGTQKMLLGASMDQTSSSSPQDEQQRPYYRSVHVAPFTFSSQDEVSPNNFFRIYDRAFGMEGVSNIMADQFSVSAVLLFNLALCMHQTALNHNNAQELHEAFHVYELAAEAFYSQNVQDTEEPQGASTFLEDSPELFALRLGLLTNAGHILCHLGRREEALGMLQHLLQGVRRREELRQISPGDLDFFALLATVAPMMIRSTVAAAA